MTLVASKIGFQHVGSFLRPQAIKEARAKFAKKEITFDQLHEIENQEIGKLIKKEAEAGLDYVTDGEFRRSYWHLDFFWGFGGVKHTHYGEGYRFAHEETRDDSAVLDGKLTFDAEKHPFINDFKITKAFADENNVQAKITIPAPAQFYAELVRGDNAKTVRNFYATDDALFADIIKVYHEAILAFYDAGARVVQIDDCTWGMLVDKNFWQTMVGAGFDPEKLKDTYLRLNNGAIADLPSDLTVNTHVCRGNYHSDWAAQGGYDSVADKLFGQENVANYFLEYDSDRAGSFAPLAKVSGDKRVVLGLITSKSPVLEDRQVIIDRIHQAEKYLPLDRLWLSTQCGFASTEEGNELTEADEWKKLALVKSIIEEVWG
ncbi:5-methyltetrahydropteroyltriglutamate--homocysteine S-methyltransferase [Oenococcus kitaharae]|uniref:Methionine synthase II (Cobalamin-independent) n=1 Tax=Oenococcus kitaharae DSM 17330 TaxID=1045004 RepID=G9WGW9_9LACO|nr:5-methyltetrahydropteroyltriglutamate--homocysteine S-methyltransferase [Oenococcus kitaharae]EHN59377.1 Methionine synthase II (cobalamin-independent) [Oenococcus kitaharae DSM 17330]OEY83259.1 5-methyltetrahydropteroyltriglutamate--homocysteine methyltransferase [Oenococcus kitaharae]OEY85057.1 5-methyltetrahydropteroyltriglutamate--homocysteine methyltransferase [Oenococcus kitaharae]OEY85912.1 5-methyltetrahydropteroyltriglutamate--homocysteine methyltransferase [Oenococcus kitaharae]